MGPLKPILIAALLLSTSPAAANAVARWEPHIVEASTRFDVPAEWIRRVMRAESGGRTSRGGRPIVSQAGAMGLMQLMPATWHDMRRRLRLGADPHDPRDNILAGSAYLRLMYDRFGYPGLFAAYNAGPQRYARHLAGKSRLPRETIAYMAAVTRSPVTAPPIPAGSSRASPLFAVVPNGPVPTAAVVDQQRDDAVGGVFALRPPARP